MAQKGKKWQGRVPADGIKIAGCELENVRWTLYARHANGNWLNCKLVADVAPHKANYWFGVDVERGKLTKNRDVALLVEYQPMIHQWIIETLDCADAAAPEDRIYESVDTAAIARDRAVDATLAAHGDSDENDDFSDLIGS